MRTIVLCSTYLKLSLGPIDGILQINFSAQLLNEAQGNMFFLRKFHVKKPVKTIFCNLVSIILTAYYILTNKLSIL